VLRAKFAAYHRYRVSARASRDYDGFPTILVVTHGPGAENRLANAVLATDNGQATPLGVLLTTAELLARVDGGLFRANLAEAGTSCSRVQLAAVRSDREGSMRAEAPWSRALCG